jgi:hypothetical protein
MVSAPLLPLMISLALVPVMTPEPVMTAMFVLLVRRGAGFDPQDAIAIERSGRTRPFLGHHSR